MKTNTNTQTVTIRIPAEQKDKLMEIASIEGKAHFSQVIKDLVQAKIEMGEGSSGPVQNSVAAELVSCLDNIMNLQDRRDRFQNQLRGTAAKKRGALTESIRAMDAELLRLTLKVRGIRETIESELPSGAMETKKKTTAEAGDGDWDPFRDAFDDGDDNSNDADNSQAKPEEDWNLFGFSD